MGMVCCRYLDHSLCERDIPGMMILDELILLKRFVVGKLLMEFFGLLI